MKNIELYRTIEALVEAKKEKISPTAPSFAHDYCQRQIEKKKLISFNPKEKMNRIMQNFNKVETYVNVEELFHYIHVAHEGKKKEDICETMKWVSSEEELGTVGYDLILKAREKLGPRNYQNYMRENKDVGNLITDLEHKSNVGIHKKQNSINTNDVNFFMQNTKDKKEEKEIKNFDKEKDIWKLYGVDKCACTDMSERRELLPLVVERPIEKQSLKKEKEKNELIHQVATYLQIILENQHKKKWGIHRFEKGCELFSVRSASNSNRKEKCSRLSRKTERHQKCSFGHSHSHSNCNSMEASHISTAKMLTERRTDDKKKIFLGMGKRKQNKENKANSNDNSCSLNEDFGESSIDVGSGKYIRDTKRSPTLNKEKLKENFTFRNRNIKTKLLRRLNSFLDLVETEEQKLKKEKNISLNELNTLEHNNKINHSRFDKHSIIEDHQIKEVHNIVHLQK